MSLRTASRDLLAHFPLADGLFRRFVWSRMHFPEVEMRFLESLPAGNVDIAIDVGAALGSYAWILNRKAEQVFSFEPGEVHGRYLERVVFGTKIRLMRCAVGSDCSNVSMFTPGTDTEALHSATLSRSNPVTNSSNARVREVTQVTLDSVFIDRLDQGRSIDILKVDVEGYELEVFRGALALIERHHPLIFCEIERRHNAEYGRVFDLLRDRGYQSYVFQGDQFRLFEGLAIDHLQSTAALETRLGEHYDPAKNAYINNFVFQHPQSRIKASK